MTTELNHLTLVSLLTAILWIPYILNLVSVRGFADALGYPDNPKPLAPWAARLKAAHYNAVENLVVFAPLVVVAHLVSVNTPATALACTVYLWARVVHAVAYALAIPGLRTGAFAVGWLCTLALGVEIVTA